jgi:hypothetical protein
VTCPLQYIDTFEKLQLMIRLQNEELQHNCAEFALFG